MLLTFACSFCIIEDTAKKFRREPIYMSRRKAREAVLCLVFMKDYHRDTSCEILHGDFFENCLIEELYAPGSLKKADGDYIKNTFFGIFENIEKIDGIVSGSTVGWQYERVSRVSVALLRIAAYEILYAGDVPTPVAVNEAVELSKRYDDPDAYTFVNEVLGAVAKMRNEE